MSCCRCGGLLAAPPYPCGHRTSCGWCRCGRCGLGVGRTRIMGTQQSRPKRHLRQLNGKEQINTLRIQKPCDSESFFTVIPSFLLAFARNVAHLASCWFLSVVNRSILVVIIHLYISMNLSTYTLISFPSASKPQKIYTVLFKNK